jgi:P27 family predicted phage terminase small subunit
MMPRGGQNRKSLRAKELAGTARADRIRGMRVVRGGKDEERPGQETVRPLPAMDRYARAAWRELEPKLTRLGLLTTVDGMLFAVFCETWGRWERARRRLTKMFRSREADPTMIRKAEVSVERAEFGLRQLADAFGLTPVSRSRLDIDLPANDDDEDESFFAFLNR